MAKRGKTSYIREQINLLAQKYLEGELDDEAMLNATFKCGEAVWHSIITQLLEKYGEYVTREDLWLVVKEAILESIKRLKPDGNPFSYIRRWVRGRLLEYIKTQAFPFTYHPKAGVHELERVSLDEILEGVEYEGEETPPPLVFVDTGFVLSEIKDVVSKVLTPEEREVFWLMFDGYNSKEIATKLKLDDAQVRSLIRKVRRKLKKEWFGGGGGS